LLTRIGRGAVAEMVVVSLLGGVGGEAGSTAVCTSVCIMCSEFVATA